MRKDGPVGENAISFSSNVILALKHFLACTTPYKQYRAYRDTLFQTLFRYKCDNEAQIGVTDGRERVSEYSGKGKAAHWLMYL